MTDSPGPIVFRGSVLIRPVQPIEGSATPPMPPDPPPLAAAPAARDGNAERHALRLVLRDAAHPSPVRVRGRVRTLLVDGRAATAGWHLDLVPTNRTARAARARGARAAVASNDR